MGESAAKQRQPVDFEDFERRLRGTMGPAPTAVVTDPDPLSELARLVGNTKDPFADVFAARKAAKLQPVMAEPMAAATSYAPDESAAPALVDGGEWAATEPVDTAPYVEAAQPRRAGRAMLLMGVALVAVIGGIGATFAYRSGAIGVREPPTIKASSDPVKIQPVRVADAPTQSSSLLDKTSGDAVSRSKVVDTVEQPVDLNQAARAPRVIPAVPATTATASPPAASSAASPFPEPRRVKTVSIRPDGTVLGSDPTPAPAAPQVIAAVPASTTAMAGRQDAIAAIASGSSPTQGAASATPATRSATPKTTARVATPAKPETAAVADATPAVPAKARVASVKTDAADAAPTTTASLPASGGFGVQLAAPGSEPEAREAIARLQKKFAGELSGHKLSWQKADSNGRTVFRVRASGLSRDDATALCTKLQAGGGTCFVAKG